jgi:hypothetical protein
MCTDEEAQLVLFTALDVIEYAQLYRRCLLSLKKLPTATPNLPPSLLYRISSPISALYILLPRADGLYFISLSLEPNAILLPHRSPRLQRQTTFGRRQVKRTMICAQMRSGLQRARVCLRSWPSKAAKCPEIREEVSSLLRLCSTQTEVGH